MAEGFTATTEGIEKLGNLQASPSMYLGTIGMPGMTATWGYWRLERLKKAKPSMFRSRRRCDSIVGQIAKLKNCRVIGSAGSDAKVQLLTEELGFDHAFNYNNGQILGHLQEAAPGIDIYFDNVRRDHLSSCNVHMRQFGRIPLCGAIAQYNDTELDQALTI